MANAAIKLEHALGMPVEYWLNLAAHYRETRASGRRGRTGALPSGQNAPRQRLQAEMSHKKSAVK